MDTENEQVETVETVEDDSAFDSGWDGDDGPNTTDADDMGLGDDVEESSDAQPDEEPTEPEETEESDDTDKAEDEAEEKPETKADEEDQLIDIKVNGEDKKLSRSELIALAQKGADYDRVKQERDTFKQDAPTIQRYKAQEAFLKELADSSGVDIETLMDSTRVRMMMAQAEENGEDLTEAQALERAKAARQPKEEPKPESTPDPEEANRKMLLDFLAIYPDVDANSIPPQVWQESAVNGDLVGAYQRYENRQLKEQIATLKQNKKNKERSTGSRRTAGATTPKDAFEEGWDSDF